MMWLEQTLLVETFIYYRPVFKDNARYKGLNFDHGHHGWSDFSVMMTVSVIAVL